MNDELCTYPAHPRYRLLALFSLVMAVLLGWQLVRAWDRATLLFLAIAAGLALWYAHAMSARVTLDCDRITLHRALFGPRTVEFRQLVDVYEEGRLGRSILLAYHPFTAEGLVDLDHAEALALPAVAEQAALFATLQQRVPP